MFLSIPNGTYNHKKAKSLSELVGAVKRFENARDILPHRDGELATGVRNKIKNEAIQFFFHTGTQFRTVREKNKFNDRTVVGDNPDDTASRMRFLGKNHRCCGVPTKRTATTRRNPTAGSASRRYVKFLNFFFFCF